MAIDEGEGALKETARLIGAKLSAGLVLKQTFSVFFKNILSFGLITLCVLWPVILLQGYLGPADRQNAEIISAGQLLVFVLASLLTPLVTGALTYGVFEVVRDHNVSIGDLFRVGLMRLPSVLLVGLAQGALILIGMFLLFVPGLIAACILAVAVPAAVIERTKVTESILRSAALTKSFRWTVFGVILSLGILQVISGLALGVVYAVSQPMWFVGYFVISILFPGLSATAGSLLYYHLRSEKEVLNVEAIAEVFA